MNKLMTMFSDGSEGNPISLMRVISFLMVITVIATKFWNAYITKGMIVWESTDFEIIGTAFGAKTVQSIFENKSSSTVTLQAPTK